MVQSPDIEIPTYNMDEHKDENGWPCHGKHDTSGESRSMYKPSLSRDMVLYMENYIFWKFLLTQCVKCT
jgi:hypothetical protein